MNHKILYILCFYACFAVSCGRSAGYTPEYSSQTGSNTSNTQSRNGGSGIDSEDGRSADDREDGEGGEEGGEKGTTASASPKSNNGLGSLNEEARSETNPDDSNFRCKYLRQKGTVVIDGAFPLPIPYPFQDKFGGQWSDDDSQYKFTMVIGKLIDNKRIPAICYDDPENGQCAGKEAYQVKVIGGPDIGGRFSLHHFDVTVHNANSDNCDVDAKKA